MKRILLAISFISFAAQTPMHAESTTAQLIKENFHAYAYDAKQLASKVPVLADKVLQSTETVLTLPFVLAGKGLETLAKGFENRAKAIEPGIEEIEPTVAPIFQTIGNGLVSAGNGLVYVGTNYPATSIVALTTLSLACWAKGFNCDQNNQRKQADFYMFAGLASGIASLAVLANVCVENGIQF